MARVTCAPVEQLRVATTASFSARAQGRPQVEDYDGRQVVGGTGGRWPGKVQSRTTAPNGTASSANEVAAPRKPVINAARPELGNRWVRVRWSVRAWARRPPGNTISRVIPAQACDRRLAAPAGSMATMAPFRYPTELPTTTSATMRCSASA